MLSFECQIKKGTANKTKDLALHVITSIFVTFNYNQVMCTRTDLMLVIYMCI